LNRTGSLVTDKSKRSLELSRTLLMIQILLFQIMQSVENIPCYLDEPGSSLRILLCKSKFAKIEKISLEINESF